MLGLPVIGVGLEDSRGSAPAPSDYAAAHPETQAPVAELFLPAAPTRRRPHRLRDLAMLALALIVVAAATQAVATAPHMPTAAAR